MWVMAPVSAFLHHLGIRILWYLDEWLILASSQEEAWWAIDKVLALYLDFGILVNLEKSSLIPSQTLVYLGIKIESWTSRALPTPLRIEKFFSIAAEFLSSKLQSARLRRVLLGHLASLTHLVPWRLSSDEGPAVGSQTRLGLSGRLDLSSLGLPFSRGSSVVVRRGSS